MGKLRITRKFGQTPTEVLNHKEISFKAKGLYGYIQSKPDGWEFSVQRISCQSKDGKDSIRNGLKELEKFGYLERVKYQNDNGHWEVDYILHDIPTTVKPSLENPTSENPPSENLKTNSKIDYSKKDYSKREKEEVVLPFDNSEFKKKWEEWKTYKKEEFNFKYKSLLSENSALTDLKNKSKNDVNQAVKIIHQSISNGWKGFFELKNEFKTKNNGEPREKMYGRQTESELRRSAEGWGDL